MESRLTPALVKAADPFRLQYGAYVYLSALEGEVPSSTWSLLRRIRAGDPEAILGCMHKLLEEQEEVRLVLEGRHHHEGRSVRDTLVNELQQSLYWPCLLAVGRGVAYEVVRLPAFLDYGLSGREPAKAEVQDTGRNEVAVLRRMAVAAGRALARFNGANPAERPLSPREIALADLLEMARKEYLAPYLAAAGIRNQ